MGRSIGPHPSVSGPLGRRKLAADVPRGRAQARRCVCRGPNSRRGCLTRHLRLPSGRLSALNLPSLDHAEGGPPPLSSAAKALRMVTRSYSQVHPAWPLSCVVSGPGMQALPSKGRKGAAASRQSKQQT